MRPVTYEGVDFIFVLDRLMQPFAPVIEVLETDYLSFSSLPIFCAAFRASRFGMHRTAQQLLELVKKLT